MLRPPSPEDGSQPPRPPSSHGIPSPVVCTCFDLTADDLRRIVRAHGCRSVEDVSERTGACRGCQTCRPDIEAILREAAGP